jgi:hypothetical protein
MILFVFYWINNIEDERSMNGRKTKFIRYKGVVLPKFAEQTLDKLNTFEVRRDICGP